MLSLCSILAIWPLVGQIPSPVRDPRRQQEERPSTSQQNRRQHRQQRRTHLESRDFSPHKESPHKEWDGKQDHKGHNRPHTEQKQGKRPATQRETMARADTPTRCSPN